MAGLLSVFAQFERDLLSERVRAGIAEARGKGKQLGRPATAALHAREVRKLYRSGLSKSEIARGLNIGAPHFAVTLAAARISEKIVMDVAVATCSTDLDRY